MAIFCYRTAEGVLVERDFSIGKAPAKVTLWGRTAVRSLVDELAGQGAPPTTGYPITCVASGVQPDQAGELRDHLASRGVPTQVTPDGDPVYRDAQHRRKALGVRGLHDRNCYC